MASVRVQTTRIGRSISSARTDTATRSVELRFITGLTLVVLLLTSAPYLYATLTTPGDREFMGIGLGVADHTQYFAWMRDFTTGNLAANRLTSEPNDPVFFNLLWWTLGRLEAVTGLDYAQLFTMLRVSAVVICLGAIYWFLSLVMPVVSQRRSAMLIATFGSGLGFVWVLAKYLTGRAEAPFPRDIDTAEPNTLLIGYGFPHFTLALGLIVAVLGFSLLAMRERNYAFAVAAGTIALVLGLQHAYDLITLYAVLGLFGLLLWVRDRRFPWTPFFCGTIVAGMSAPPAIYSFWLVTQDAVWGQVLDQFDDANVFTPNLLHLPIMLGLPLIFALFAFRPRMLLSRDDTELFVAAWFVAHLPLVYLPVDFQIHLLLGWQVPIAIFAARAIATRLAPAVASRTWLTWQSAAALLVIVTFATNAYLLAWRFVELGRHDAPYFMSDNDVAALDWLDGHATRNDVVFSDPEIGQFVPMSSDARAFVGHWANTLDYGDKRNLVASVFSADATPDAREAAFAKYGVTLVVARPGNGQGSGLFSASDPGAELVFQQGDVAIYRVTDGR